MKKRIFAGTAAVILFIMSLFNRVYAQEPQRTYEMKTLLMEAETGTVVKESGGFDRAAQGTLNKLMTVLLAAEEVESGNLTLESELTASSNASTQKGAVIWLASGENITLGEAVKAVIVGNANDASMVIAEEIGGSEEEFVGMMNARAFELGMRNTVFKNAAGFDALGQYSTAYDIALLCREVLKHEFLRGFMTTWIDRVRGGQTEIVNENRLVRTYDGILGLKAAHSEESGQCLALAAERDGKRYIAVVMGCGDEDERFSVGKKLMSDGFAYFKVTTPLFSGEFIKPITVKGGISRAVGIKAEHLTGLVVPESGGEISTVVFLPEYLEAPVRKGQKIGCAGFYNGDTLLFETALIAEENVKKTSFISSAKVFLHNLYK